MTFHPHRRSILSGLTAVGLAAGCAPKKIIFGRNAPGIAITIDDFDLSDTVLMSGTDRDAEIRAALARYRLKASGFVVGKYVDRDKLVSDNVLSRWSDASHILGNHSFSHQKFNGQNPNELMTDILRCESLLSGYSSFRKLFRFPYLAEGKTENGRDRMRGLLKQHGYKNAHVTIDTSDWYIDNRLKARIKLRPNDSLEPYRRFYLNHIWDRATYYDGLAKSLFGHSIDHTILLHHRLTTGLFLNDMLSMFRDRGWRLIDADTAFDSQVFALEPNSVPAGQSLVWAVAKATGRFDSILRYPGEDGVYEASKMDAMAL